MIRDSTASLVAKYPDQNPSTLEAAVREEVLALSVRPVRDFVSVLAERAVKDKLGLKKR